MFTLLFIILMFAVFGKLFIFGLKATWGITKILFAIVFLPLILVCMVVGGLIYVAFPILLVVGLCSLIFAHN